MLSHKVSALSLALCASMLPMAAAAPVEFASFTNPPQTQKFVLTNNGGTSVTASLAVEPIQFSFETGPYTGTYDATLQISSSSFVPAMSAGSILEQPLSGSFKITLDSALGGFTNALSGSFTSDAIGFAGGRNIDITADTGVGNTVTFKSDFFNFAGSTSRSFQAGSSDANPVLSIGAGGFLSSFAADLGTGSFSADNIVSTTPEPTNIALTGAIAAGLFLLWKARSRRERV